MDQKIQSFIKGNGTFRQINKSCHVFDKLFMRRKYQSELEFLQSLKEEIEI